MEKRYQVFVSSTYEDLKEERAKAITSLLNIDCIPCGMEYFPSADEEAWECIERLIPQCDFYVIIIGGKYGSSPKGDPKSYTHKEYLLALKNNIPIVRLLRSDLSKLPMDKCETEAERRHKFDQFRTLVTSKLCRFWQTPDQLATEMISSLTKLMRSTTRPGWVRSDSLASDEAKDEIINLRRKIEEQDRLLKIAQDSERQDIENLAGGDDNLTMLATATGSSDDWKHRFSAEVSFISTWNQVLQLLRENIISTWDEYDIRTLLEELIKGRLLMNPSISKACDWIKVKIQDSEINMLLTQFNALGHVCKRGNKWDFTSKGLAFASKMTALRRGQVRTPGVRDVFKMELQNLELS